MAEYIMMSVPDELSLGTLIDEVESFQISICLEEDRVPGGGSPNSCFSPILCLEAVPY